MWQKCQVKCRERTCGTTLLFEFSTAIMPALVVRLQCRGEQIHIFCLTLITESTSRWQFSTVMHNPLQRNCIPGCFFTFYIVTLPAHLINLTHYCIIYKVACKWHARAVHNLCIFEMFATSSVSWLINWSQTGLCIDIYVSIKFGKSCVIFINCH